LYCFYNTEWNPALWRRRRRHKNEMGWRAERLLFEGATFLKTGHRSLVKIVYTY
jgi:hypothetical protein